MARPSTTRAVVGAVFAVMVAVAVNLALPEGRPPVASWHGPLEAPLRLLAAAALGVLACLVLASVTDPGRLFLRLRAVRAGLAMRTTGRALLFARVAVEEALWRASLMPLLVVAFGVPLAITVSSVGFGVWHVHQGARGMLANCVNGAVFATSYLMLGGLPAAIITHTAHNLVLAALLAGQRRQTRCGQQTGRRP